MTDLFRFSPHELLAYFADLFGEPRLFRPEPYKLVPFLMKFLVEINSGAQELFGVGRQPRPRFLQVSAARLVAPASDRQVVRLTRDQGHAAYALPFLQ